MATLEDLTDEEVLRFARVTGHTSPSFRDPNKVRQIFRLSATDTERMQQEGLTSREFIYKYLFQEPLPGTTTLDYIYKYLFNKPRTMGTDGYAGNAVKSNLAGLTDEEVMRFARQMNQDFGNVADTRRHFSFGPSIMEFIQQEGITPREYVYRYMFREPLPEDEEGGQIQEEVVDEEKERIYDYLETLKKAQLIDLARTNGLRNYSTLNKDDLIDLIAESNINPFTANILPGKNVVDDQTYEDLANGFNRRTVVQLRNLARENGLSPGGNKADLVGRLVDAELKKYGTTDRL